MILAAFIQRVKGMLEHPAALVHRRYERGILPHRFGALWMRDDGNETLRLDVLREALSEP